MATVENRVHNGSDIVDSRDILERIEELESEIQSQIDEVDENYPDGPDEELTEELKILQGVIENIRSYSGDSPKDGITLIRDSYFENYARELAEDIGAINSDARWPNNCIDWEQAATELQTDYTSVDWDGVTYWCR